MLQLGEVLDNPDKYLVDGYLFLPKDKVVDENTCCAVLEWDDAENEKPQIAIEQGLEPALHMHWVKRLIDNLRQTVPKPSREMLLDAFLLSYDKDAFIERESQRAGESNLGSEWFWSIIAIADHNLDQLRVELLKLDQKELRRFHEEFVQLAAELKELKFARFVEESEDGLTDVAEWVVSQGKETYRAILNDPSSIPHTVEGKENEILTFVAKKVYEERFGDTLDLY